MPSSEIEKYRHKIKINFEMFCTRRSRTLEIPKMTVYFHEPIQKNTVTPKNRQSKKNTVTFEKMPSRQFTKGENYLYCQNYLYRHAKIIFCNDPFKNMTRIM